jgi:hypothetical protein
MKKIMNIVHHTEFKLNIAGEYLGQYNHAETHQTKLECLGEILYVYWLLWVFENWLLFWSFKKPVLPITAPSN